ncbi:uncharacterized protein BXZ73DRAFT_76781 [Epithele typhae]|uniref:uncharacterized protein n=1 Tax=Epithele typhae TaxID=378194 RepID=UPI0020079A91|nr:uncharacterized protein BXZ73DRAFT_76781 [Epithele typhae]KAH9935975.1 hypothetical protein BXZ73DRAFT_76781 [Epithele typhae]
MATPPPPTQRGVLVAKDARRAMAQSRPAGGSRAPNARFRNSAAFVVRCVRRSQSAAPRPRPGRLRRAQAGRVASELAALAAGVGGTRAWRDGRRAGFAWERRVCPFAVASAVLWTSGLAQRTNDAANPLVGSTLQGIRQKSSSMGATPPAHWTGCTPTELAAQQPSANSALLYSGPTRLVQRLKRASASSSMTPPRRPPALTSGSGHPRPANFRLNPRPLLLLRTTAPDSRPHAPARLPSSSPSPALPYPALASCSSLSRAPPPTSAFARAPGSIPGLTAAPTPDAAKRIFRARCLNGQPVTQARGLELRQRRAGVFAGENNVRELRAHLGRFVRAATGAVEQTRRSCFARRAAGPARASEALATDVGQTRAQASVRTRAHLDGSNAMSPRAAPPPPFSRGGGGRPRVAPQAAPLVTSELEVRSSSAPRSAVPPPGLGVRARARLGGRTPAPACAEPALRDSDLRPR